MRYYVVSFVLLASSLLSRSQDTWTQKADFGGGYRFWASAFAIGTKGYMGLGVYPITVNHNDWWEWDQATDTWTQKAAFPGGGRSNAAGFAIGAKGYLGMGADFYGGSNYYRDFWEFDPAANTWTQKADFGGTARDLAAGFSIGNKGYVGTGSFTRDFWEYDPAADTWTRKSDFGGPARQGAVAFTIGTKGYMGTGWDGVNFYRDWWEWDQGTDTWVQKNDFGGPARAYGVAFSIGGRGFLGTGFDGLYKKDWWEWDSQTDTWVQRTDYAQGLVSSATSFAGFALGDKGYVGLGGSSAVDFYQSLWEYTPAPDGSTCDNAITLTPQTTCNPQTFQITGNEMWFSFVADTSLLAVCILPTTAVPAVSLEKLSLFVGTCNGLQLIAADSLTLLDSTLVLTTDALVEGSVYFMKAEKSSFSSGSYDICSFISAKTELAVYVAGSYVTTCKGGTSSGNQAACSPPLTNVPGLCPADHLTAGFRVECCFGPICPGELVELSWNAGATGFDWINWYFDEAGCPNVIGPPKVNYQACTYNTLGTHQVCVQGIAGGQVQSSLLFQFEVVDPTPQVSFSISPGSVVCAGVALTLTATGSSPIPGETYNWSFDDGGTATGKTVPHVFFTPGIHTITLTVSNRCSTASATMSVTVLPVLADFTAVPTQICQGECITYTDNSACVVSWDWTFPGGVPATASGPGPHVVCYPNPGTFNTTLTVLGTDINNYSVTKPVVVNPFPDAPIITGSINSCNKEELYNVSNPVAGATYVWTVTGGTPASATGTSVAITWPDPNSGGSITVICTKNGCQSSSTLQVYPCCCDPNPPAPDITISNAGNNTTASLFLAKYDNKVNYDADPDLGEFTTKLGASLCINGTFTVNVPLSFINCPDIKMGPKAEIIVEDQLTLYNCHVYAGCNVMWYRIFLPFALPSNVLTITNNTLIEDGENAVVTEGGTLIIENNSVLNKNYKHVVIRRITAGAFSGRIRRSSFFCRDMATQTNTTLIAPYLGQRTFTGIEIDNLLTIQIGDPASLAQRNYFDNADFGIRCTRSNLAVYNNRFTNIGNTICPPPFLPPIEGAAIFAQGNTSAVYTLTVGGQGNLRNDFNMVSYGVDAQDNLNVVMDGPIAFPYSNSIQNALNGGIRIRYCADANLRGNQITGAKRGIQGIGNKKMLIRNNAVSRSGAFPAFCAFFFTGIEVRTQGGMLAGEAEIRSNTVQNIRNGIVASNLMKLLVRNNTVQNITPSGRGIWVTLCPCAVIINNTVQSVSSTNENMQGIYTAYSSGAYIGCNTVSQVGRGITCEGYMDPSEVLGNTMQQTRRGFVLNSYGRIGMQGTYIPDPITTKDNKWNLISVPFKFWSTGLSPDCSNSLFIIRDFGQFNGGNWSGVCATNNIPVPNISVTNPIVTCPLPVPSSCSLFSQKMASQGQKIALDQLTYIDANQRWWARYELYRILHQEPAMRSDALLQGFYDSLSVQPIGQLASLTLRIQELSPLAADSVFQQTAIELAQVIPLTLQEANLKTAIEVYLAAIAQWAKEYTAQQDSVLRHIAFQCPHDGGPGAILARDMLALTDSVLVVYDEFCQQAISQKTGEFNEDETLPDVNVIDNVNLYPTLSSREGRLFVELPGDVLSSVRIYNQIGQEVFYQDYMGNTVIEIGKLKLKGGVYIYKITAGFGEYLVGKIVLVE